MSYQLVRYHAGGQEQRAVIAIVGTPRRIYTPMVWIDVPLRLYRVPNGDAEKFSTPLETPKVRTAARRMLQVGKRLGITKSAKQHLRAAL